MNILQKLTVRNLSSNRRRTLVTILGVMLSTALILAVAGMVTSFQRMMIDFAKADPGDFHDMYQEVPLESIDYITNNQHVESVYYSEPVTADKIDEEMFEYYQTYQHEPYRTRDYQKLETLPVNLKDASASTNNTTRQTSQNHTEQPNSAHQSQSQTASENSKNTQTSQSKNSTSKDNTTSTDNSDSKSSTAGKNLSDRYNVYVRYDKPANYQAYRESIQSALASVTDEHINYRTNDDLLRYEAFVMGDAALATLYSMATIVIAIIIVTSVFVIRNSFSISATERSRQFGMLASIGATPRQIRHSVYFEGAIIGLIGIPLGLLLGMLAVAILVVIVNLLLEGMLAAAVQFSMPLWVFLVAILLGAVTIFLSSLMPAIHAARLSPVEAIRGNSDIKIKNKKLRTPKYVRKCFGIGGVIAHKNLRRSRKKYRTTVISIVVSVATFIGLYSFMDYGKDLTGTIYSDSKVDFVISGATPEFYHELREHFELKDSAYYLQTLSEVYLMEQSKFEEFAKSIGLNQSDYSHTAIMNPYYMAGDENGQSSKFTLQHEDVKEGEQYTVHRQPVGEMPDACYKITEDETGIHNIDWECYYDYAGHPRDIDITITKLTDQYPIGFDAMKYWTYIIVPENYYLREELGAVIDQPTNLTSSSGSLNEVDFYAWNVENGKEISEYLDEKQSTNQIDSRSYFYYQDVRENASIMRRMYLLISIFLYGFIAVVTLIGVTNIFNTITTNIALRAKEFATLKSIGMTSREFNHMVRLESLMYAGKALVIGIPLGLGLSFAFYQSVANSVDFGWIIPWGAIIISTVAVGLLISVIMHYSVRQVEKQNIIETIRSENI